MKKAIGRFRRGKFGCIGERCSLDHMIEIIEPRKFGAECPSTGVELVVESADNDNWPFTSLGCVPGDDLDAVRIGDDELKGLSAFADFIEELNLDEAGEDERSV